MRPNNPLHHMAVGASPRLQNLPASMPSHNTTDRTSLSYARQISGLSGVVVADVPSMGAPSVITTTTHKILPQKKIEIVTGPIVQQTTVYRSQIRPVSEVLSHPAGNIQMITSTIQRNGGESRREGQVSSFDFQREQLREEVKRLQGLLKKNESQCENIRRELSSKNQILSEFQRTLSSSEQIKTKFSIHIRSLEEQNLKLKSIIERMNIDRQNLVKSHQKYMKSDEAARTEIFEEVQKLQRVVQQKTRQLQQSKQRQLIIAKQFEAFRQQAGNQLNEGERNTIHLMEKLKVALEGKEVQIESLNQAIHQLDNNLTNSENMRSQQLYQMKSLQSEILRLQSENSSLKEYQSKYHNEMSFGLNEVSSLKSQVVQLQRQVEVYREKEREMLSTHGGTTEKDAEISKLRSALQGAESNGLTLQYLSKEIHNYRLIIQDLETYKQNGYKKDIEITRLHQAITRKETEVADLENDRQSLKTKLTTIQSQYRSYQESSREKIRQLEEKCVVLNRKIQVVETEKIGFTQLSSTQHDIQIAQLSKALDNSRNEFFNLRRTSEEKIFELQTTRTQLEIQIQSITQTIEQKQAERVFFENQYKTLYSQFVESRKHTQDYQPLHDEIKVLKEQLFQSKQQNNKLEVELRRILQNDNVRATFNTGEEFSRVKGTMDSRNLMKHQEQQHHRQTQSMSGLKEQNYHLKQLLESARAKLQEYSNDLEECQQRMSSFQERMETLLAGGNARPVNYQQSIYEQKQMMDQVVHQLKSKLKLFKKENEQLKRKVKQYKEENRRSREPRQRQKSNDKRRSRREQESGPRENEEHYQEMRRKEGGNNQMKQAWEARQAELKRLQTQNQQLYEQVSQVQQINTQNQVTLKQYEDNLAQYQKAITQYEARIKQYQSHILKIKHKYKEEAHMRLPEPEIERPTNSMQNVSERLEFFRAKSYESQQRVKQLLRINNELKVQLQQTSDLIGGQNLSTQKIQLLEDNISNLQKKLIKATEENLQLKAKIQNVDNNPNLSSILELKIRQLMEENSELKVQISQASNQIVALKQGSGGQYAYQPQNSADLQKLETLERKFQELNQIIYNLQAEKFQLQSENSQLKAKMGRLNMEGQNILLERISRLQQEIVQLKVLNRELQLQIKQSGSVGISMETYSTIMIEVGKLIQLTDALNSAFTNIIDDVARMGSQSLKISIESTVSEAVQLFKGIEIIKQSMGGLRQHTETETVIHEINQLII